MRTLSRAARTALLTTLLTVLAPATAGCSATPDDPAPGKGGKHALPAPPPVAPKWEPPAREKQPNILLITTDDQTDYELRYMPRTRRLLAAKGINLTDFVNPHPLCCPARAEILTGEYAQNNGVRHNAGPFGGYPAFLRNGNGQENLAVWLSRAGYNTAFVGKMLNGYKAEETPQMAGWDRWNPTTRGTYAYYGTEFFNDGKPQRHKHAYVADEVARFTRGYIDDFAGRKDPFFIWASHVGPHVYLGRGPSGPPVPAKRHEGMFAGAKPEGRDKPSYLAAPGSDAYSPDQPLTRSKSRHLAKKLRESVPARLESLQAIDEANAAMVRALKKRGEWRNTVVIFTSDNGYLIGEHGIHGKNQPYEEALQIPFVMTGPGVPQGVKMETGSTLVDINPTLLSYAGVLDRVRNGGHTDGADIRQAIRAADGRTVEGTQLIQGGTSDERALDAYGWEWRGVRTERYTYARWWDGTEQLFDRAGDPYQTHNLAKDPNYTLILTGLRGRLAQLGKCAGVEECENGVYPPLAPVVDFTLPTPTRGDGR